MRKADYVEEEMEKERKARLLSTLWRMPLSEALSMAGIRRATYLKWLKDPEFAEEAKQAKQAAIDDIEYKAVDIARRGNESLIKFVLANQRPADYNAAAKLELAGKDGGPLKFVVERIGAPTKETQENA